MHAGMDTKRAPPVVTLIKVQKNIMKKTIQAVMGVNASILVTLKDFLLF
jgi:hypothetical protein